MRIRRQRVQKITWQATWLMVAAFTDFGCSADAEETSVDATQPDTAVGDVTSDANTDVAASSDGEPSAAALQPETCEAGLDNDVVEQAVREELRLAADEVLDGARLAEVTELTLLAPEHLVGLECLVSLNRLSIVQSGDGDLSPLAELPLRDLSISGSPELRLGALTGSASLASSLQRLALVQDEIADLSDFSRLGALEILDLSSNQLSDLDGLQGLVQLTELTLSNLSYAAPTNQVTDLQPLGELRALEYLVLVGNQVQSLSGLNGLANLQVLDASDNELESLDGLNLPSLVSLRASGNEVESVGEVSDLGALTRLNLSGNALTAAAGLADLTALRELDLSDNPLEEIEALGELELLEMLQLSSTGVDDLSALEALENILELDVSRSRVSNLEPLLMWPEHPTDCRLLEVAELSLEPYSLEVVVPSLCSTTWQIADEDHWFCEDPVGCKNPI